MQKQLWILFRRGFREPSQEGSRGIKENGDGKDIDGEGARARMKRGKKSCIILTRRDSRFCLKSFFTSTSPFFHKPPYREDVNQQSWLTEQRPQDTAVSMTTDVNKSWSLWRNFCVSSLKWTEEELKCTKHLLYARLVQTASFIISF